VKPSRPLLQCLSEGKLVWTTNGATKEDTAAVAALLKSKEVCSDLISVVLISSDSGTTAAAGGASVRKRNSISATSRATTTVRPVKKPQRGAQPAHLKDATGEVRIRSFSTTMSLCNIAACVHKSCFAAATRVA
jgi:hypothetical protein